MKKVIFAVAITLSSALSFAQIRTTKPTVQLVRNASLIINYNGKKILVDPMLSPKGAIASWAGIEKNPTVELPIPVKDIVKDVDLIMVTHTHEDHFDQPAGKVLDKSIEMIIQPADQNFFKKEEFVNAHVLDDHKTWNGIIIHRIDGQHGSGKALDIMGKTSGYVLQAKSQPTIYIVGDTIWTEDIKESIRRFKPDYIIVNSGGALIPDFPNSPIIMDLNQTMSLLAESGQSQVIAVHMNALDHCFTTRAMLKSRAAELHIGEEKLFIPEDGEVIEL